MQPLIIILILVALAWVLIVIPQRRRSRSHEAMQDELAVGDEIITAGGLHAVVVELGDDDLVIEIAPKVLVTLDRRAVAAVAHDEHDGHEHHHHDEHDGHDHDEHDGHEHEVSSEAS